MYSEQAFHDRQAGLRSATFRADPTALIFGDDASLDHESWLRPALARLGDVSGLDVLDYGCGHGMAAVVLARRASRERRVGDNGPGGQRAPCACPEVFTAFPFTAAPSHRAAWFHDARALPGSWKSSVAGKQFSPGL
jgi:hypothetical protein